MEKSAQQLGAKLDTLVNTTQICPTCRDLQPGDEDNELNIIQIQSLRDNCGYCRILKASMINLADGPTTQIFVYSKDGEPISVQYFSEKKPGTEDSYASKAGFIIYSHDKSRLLPDLGILSAYPESTELDASVNFINAQMSECSTKHEICRKQLESPLPTRVVSVGASDAHIRLVELKNVPARYVTLSHCWGGKQPLKTITANLEDMKKSIDANFLPIVFQQAIWIVRMLKIEYIWIDSLCIIQDSQSDWELESMQMCDYYENSFLTISTATSPDSTIPFLGPRDKRWWPAKLNLTIGSSSEDLYAQRIPNEPDEEGLLFTRAWTWQEAAMSSRTIYFTPSELIWECPEHVMPQRYIPDVEASERLGFSKVLSMLRFSLNPDMNRDLIRSVGDSSDDILRNENPMSIHPPSLDSAISSNASALSRPDSPSSISSEANIMDYVWDMWDDLVTYYSRRHLTFVTDKLPALSGVASRVHEITKSRYLAGLWEDNLGVGLLWAREWRGYQDLPTLSSVYVAPSWSWASIHGAVKSRVQRTISTFEPSFTIIEAESNVSGLNPFGGVTAGHLVMRAQIAEAMLTCDDPQTSIYYKISGPTDDWDFSPDSILVLNNGNVSRARQDAKLSKFTAKIHCLYIGSTYSAPGDESDRKYYMLVLSQSENDDSDKSFCRLGLAYSQSNFLFKGVPVLNVKVV
ncbi:HET-domain-containing [Fusarium acutatum]|uniref:HET-domain-containing n=1 Tax=Fusarium acutatum TaxID=78861 RepID=A0A8H4JWW1_9HYPO|nr:HET-domain-containing [Fusarium acutatum]